MKYSQKTLHSSPERARYGVFFVSSKGNILCRLVKIELYKIFAIINRAIKGLHCTIIWTSAGISLIGPLKANFSDILIEIQTFWFKKIRLKMLSVKCCPLRLGLNVLNQTAPPSLNSPWSFTYSGVKGESQPYSQRCSGVRNTKNPFYGHRLISISAWMSTYINYTVWDENIHSQCLSTAQPLRFGNG